jgi:hypothetical protein
MNKKRRTALTLLLIFVIGALSGLSITVGAAESDNTAVVKLYNNGELTETLSCSVGHVITVVTQLNTSDIDGGRISAVEGYQTYTSDKLALMDELDEDYMIVDTDSVFPLISENALGHLDEDGTLYFTSFTLSPSKPFIFDSEDGRLIVTRYKVTSAGESEISTTLNTLAKNDRSITKIINKGVVQDGYNFDFISHTAPYVTANSISLKDEIGINYYIYIPDYYTGEKSVTFTWGNDGYNKKFTAVPVSTSSYGANYKVSCPVSARSMTDTVHMSLTDNEKEIFTYNYSIAKYTELAAAAYSEREDLKDLLCYMLEYGAAAQRKFEYKTSGDNADVADSCIANIYSDEVWGQRKAEAPVSLDDKTDIDSFDFNDNYGMKYYGASMSTTSKTVIRLYFTVTDNDLFASTSASAGGEDLSFHTDTTGKYKYIEISGISAKNIFDPNTVTFTNGTNSVDRVYSAANYYNYTLNQNQDAKVIDILKAMYNYSASAAGVLKAS